MVRNGYSKLTHVVAKAVGVILAASLAVAGVSACGEKSAESTRSKGSASSGADQGGVGSDWSSIDWGGSHAMGSGGGQRPAVTTIGGGPTVVEVHQSSSPGDKSYWSTVGSFDAQTGQIDWGDGQQTGDSGDDESLAVASLSDGTVIQIHEASGSNDGLYYAVGRVQSGNSIDWSGPGRSMGTDGTDVGIASMDDSNSTVVAIHEATSNNGLWYQIGTVSGDRTTVDWGESQDTGTTGSKPAIAAIDEDTVVEMHESSNGTEFWYSIGELDGGSIDWGVSHDMDDSGWSPQLTVVDDSTVVEVHTAYGGGGGKGEGPMRDQYWYSIGQVDGDSIDWGESQKAPVDIEGAGTEGGETASVAALDFGDNSQVALGYFSPVDFNTEGAIYYLVGALQ